MKTSFIGDLHIGYKRTSFTSPVAHSRYANEILKQAKLAIEVESSTKIQVGDVFDKFRDTDATLVNGVGVAQHVNIVVVGNHDISNTIKERSTMVMCDKMVNSFEGCRTNFVFPSQDDKPTATIYVAEAESTAIVVVPYCYTQDQFSRSIDRANKLAIDHTELRHKILVLHTNYNLGYELTETTNNLAKETAVNLLENFSYIVSGHEHNYSKHLKGRLIMTGSVMPVSTAELENKYVHVFDSDTGQFSKQIIWDAKVRAVTYDANAMPSELPKGTQFVSISGKTNSPGVVLVQKRISEYWKTCGSLLVCKPEYEVATQERKSTAIVKTDMVGHIRGLLKPPAKKLLDKMVKELDQK